MDESHRRVSQLAESILSPEPVEGPKKDSNKARRIISMSIQRAGRQASALGRPTLRVPDERARNHTFRMIQSFYAQAFIFFCVGIPFSNRLLAIFRSFTPISLKSYLNGYTFVSD